jgi:hypothetical protein
MKGEARVRRRRATRAAAEWKRRGSGLSEKERRENKQTRCVSFSLDLPAVAAGDSWSPPLARCPGPLGFAGEREGVVRAFRGSSRSVFAGAGRRRRGAGGLDILRGCARALVLFFSQCRLQNELEGVCAPGMEAQALPRGAEACLKCEG